MGLINRELHELYLPLRRACINFLSYANGHIDGYYLDIFETVRSRDRQISLSSKGSSWVSVSLHELTLAFDLWLCDELGNWVAPEILNDWPHWDLVGDMGEAHGLEWGGRWKQRDMVHFQSRFGVDSEELRKIYLSRGVDGVQGFLNNIIENKKNIDALLRGEE